MNKPQFYLSQCMEAASKSPMYYTLGSAIIKGGKVVSTGYNHQRPNYDTPGGGKPLSMHAEMASIFNATRGQALQRAAEEEEKQPKKHHHHIHLQQQRQQQQQQGEEGNYTTNGAYYNNYPNGNNNTTTNNNGAVRCPLVPSRDLDSRPRPRRAPYAVSTAPARRMDSATRHQLHHHQQYRHYPHGYEGERTETERGRKARAKADAGKWQKRATARRRIRLAKLNGADLYVCRVTRSGELACSKPCWRCIEWCAWAGIKRIFHWSVLEQRFICLKVAEAAATHDCYETVMDSRLLASPAVLLRG
uniref:CMP/dCMP-type deaminase domain-containing protein n=1 Tax=Mycena chlorophos TaxID=658473 RepID=A0ABQ0LA13_MYCCL|nr:predicted protein [Mycena chlorophos]